MPAQAPRRDGGLQVCLFLQCHLQLCCGTRIGGSLIRSFLARLTQFCDQHNTRQRAISALMILFLELGVVRPFVLRKRAVTELLYLSLAAN